MRLYTYKPNAAVVFYTSCVFIYLSRVNEDE